MSSNLQHLATPRRKAVDHHFNEESVKQIALMQVEAAKIPYYTEDGDRCVIVHSDVGQPRVKFYPLKMRWLEAGNPKRHRGDAVKFIAWFREREGVLK